MTGLTPDELRACLAPIESLLAKSEKAQQRVGTETWQHSMLEDNIRALRIAEALLDRETGTQTAFAMSALEAASKAIASMIKRSRDAQAKLSEGTAQYSLLQHRLKALHVAAKFIDDAMRSATT